MRGRFLTEDTNGPSRAREHASSAVVVCLEGVLEGADDGPRQPSL